MPRRSERRAGLTRRQFVESSSRLTAGAALLSKLPRAVSPRGLVASEPEAVARAGALALERGGNAADAAAAACLAGCLIHPHLSDLGGYVCCAVVLDAKSNRAWSLDANSVAPAAAHEKMFTILPVGPGAPGINENEYGCSVRNDSNVYGPLAVAVPGTMGGIGVLQERWGILKWRDVVAPSLELAEQGFPYGWTAEAIKLKEAVIRRYEPSLGQLMPRGSVPRADEVWRRPDMAKTLERIAAAGWRDFYEGELGRRIADYVGGLGGVVTRKDMAGFQARVTEPYTIAYRNASVHGAILPNGALSTLQMLNMLDCFEPARDSAALYWHRLAEVLKLAWRDRLLYLGDPGFARVPVERLLAKDYAAGRVETLRQFPRHVDRMEPPLQNAAPQGTLHVSTADAAGNLVSVTISHGGFFGSCLTVPGTGITLGHGMCRFDPHPGLPNSVGARKRPLNNVAPLLVRLPERDVALGLRGGRRIVSVSAQLAARVVDDGASAAAASAAPRIHVQAKEPGEVADSLARSIREELAAMGHELRAVPDLVVGAHGTEVLKGERRVRGGGNGVARTAS